MQWAATQDWMCEESILEKTGFDIPTHQLITVMNYLDLKWLAPEIPWVPVLQGWTGRDYFRHVDLYRRHGVDLEKLPLVGMGSVCRRAHFGNVFGTILELRHMGIRLHGFGMKMTALAHLGEYLESSDSLAWSFDARQGRQERMEGCTHPGKCNNCSRWALAWRERLLGGLAAAA
jgi:hypothetical protein